MRYARVWKCAHYQRVWKMALLWHVWNRARYCVWECAHYSVRSRNANSTRAPSAVYRLRLDIRQQALSQCTGVWWECVRYARVKVCAWGARVGLCASSAGVECAITACGIVHGITMCGNVHIQRPLEKSEGAHAPIAVYRLRLDIRQQALSQCTSMWVGVCALRASVKVCALRACCVGVCALYACAGVCASSAGVECGIIMACLWNRARYCVWECAHYSARSRNAIALIRRSLSTGLALSQCKGVWVGVCALCAYVEVRALSAGVELSLIHI